MTVFLLVCWCKGAVRPGAREGVWTCVLRRLHVPPHKRLNMGWAASNSFQWLVVTGYKFGLKAVAESDVLAQRHMPCTFMQGVHCTSLVRGCGRARFCPTAESRMACTRE